MAELTAQVIALTDQLNTLTSRLSIAEQNQTLHAAQAGSRGGGDAGVFDKKRLYPKEMKEAASFRSWSERFQQRDRQSVQGSDEGKRVHWTPQD